MINQRQPNFRIIDKRGMANTGSYEISKWSNYNVNRPSTTDTGSGIYHDRFERTKILSVSRELYRTNYLYQSIIDAAINIIVGGEDNFNIQIRSDNKEFSDVTEQYISSWLNDSPDDRGMYTGVELLRVICTEILVTGEVFIIKLNNGKVQLIESELCGGQILSDDGYVDGILFDDDKPIAYKFYSYNEIGMPDTEKYRVIDASDVIHVFVNPRISGIRGIPPLQSTFDLVFRLSDIVQSESISWEVISRIALIAQRKNGPQIAFEENQSNTNQTDFGSYIEDWDIAKVFHADIEEDLRTLDRNIPSKDFGNTLMEFIRLIASPLGLPGEFVNCNFNRSNYSQSKASTLFAFRSGQKWQRRIKNIAIMIVNWKLTSVFGESLPVYKVDVYLPRAIRLDEQKEIAATESKITSCLTTMQDAVSELGWDYAELIKKRKNEILQAINISKEIEKETGEKVPWQLFSGLGSVADSPKQLDMAQLNPNEENTDEVNE